jgi:hypothetical protein
VLVPVAPAPKAAGPVALEPLLVAEVELSGPSPGVGWHPKGPRPSQAALTSVQTVPLASSMAHGRGGGGTGTRSWIEVARSITTFGSLGLVTQASGSDGPRGPAKHGSKMPPGDDAKHRYEAPPATPASMHVPVALPDACSGKASDPLAVKGSNVTTRVASAAVRDCWVADDPVTLPARPAPSPVPGAVLVVAALLPRDGDGTRRPGSVVVRWAEL